MARYGAVHYNSSQVTQIDKIECTHLIIVRFRRTVVTSALYVLSLWLWIYLRFNRILRHDKEVKSRAIRGLNAHNPKAKFMKVLPSEHVQWAPYLHTFEYISNYVFRRRPYCLLLTISVYFHISHHQYLLCPSFRMLTQGYCWQLEPWVGFVCWGEMDPTVGM